MPRSIKNQRGVALIITLWVMVMLSVMAASFALSARLGSAGARNFKDDTLAHYVAVSAYEEALAWLATDPDPDIDYMDEKGHFRTDKDRPAFTGTYEYEGAKVKVTVTDEESRYNLNLVTDYILRRLLERSGVKEEEIPPMVDAFLDWKDTDDLTHLDGAEDDYYEPLGYKAKNGLFDTPEELLLVKGFTNEVYFGGGDSMAMASRLTTWSRGININTVPSDVLELMNIDPLDINTIIQARKDGGTRLVPSGLGDYGRTFSNFYRICVESTVHDSPQTVKLTAIIERKQNDKGQELAPLYWKEEIEAGGT